jgi:myosin heavy subunit
MLNSKVWVKNNNNDWEPGIYIGKLNNKYQVSINDNILLYDHIENKNDDDADNVDNLINIPHLNEPSILNCIQIRYNENKIYTYTGKILISVNPFKDLGLYNNDIANGYKINKLIHPHIYQICNLTYKNISQKNNNQSILVSGESGAGKTHATKLIMEYLVNISGKGIKIKNKIINANPILEAFGNAKTIHNDNSSRFGKFIKLKFNKNNKLTGASIESYLLEKIRLIHQGKNERNFHIFYQLIDGMSDKEKDLYYINNINHKYLNDGFIRRDDGVIDKIEYNITLDAFKYLDFSNDEINNILKITSGILNLGSIDYDENGNIINIEQLDNVSKLLNISNKILHESLCYRNLSVNGEEYRIKLEKREAITLRDSLAMKLYGKLFDNIVKLINRSINNDEKIFIGILDIFGFESIEENNFEQLCINYTNEQLQNQFNKYIFKLEQDEYKREQINWENISFPDNKDILNLIDSKNSILNALDEECKLPKGNDKNFNSKLVKIFNDNEHFIVNKRYINERFGIKHYAGDVMYNSNGFCEKNKDIVSNEINFCINSMKYNFFQSDNNNVSIIKSKSLSYKFKKQLKQLISVIDNTETHYIRCLKPNNKNLPNLFDRKKVINQLNYCGVIEAIKVSRSGYAVRILHDKFLKKYKMIDELDNINDIKFLDNENYQVGITKIFLKTNAYEKIEDMRIKYINLYAIIIQKNIRTFIEKSKYKRIVNRLIILQSFCRQVIAKKKYIFIKRDFCAKIIQTRYRSYLKRKKYIIYLRRMYLIKNIYIKYRKRRRNNAVIIIQALIRNTIKKKENKAILWNKSAIVVQRNYKMHLDYCKYVRIYNKIVLIQRKVKRFLNNRNKIIKRNKELKKRLEERDNKISELENTYNEVKDIVKNITNDKKKLNDDIDMFKECITKNINDKVNMINEIEKLKRDNIRIKKELANKKKTFWNWNFF